MITSPTGPFYDTYLNKEFGEIFAQFFTPNIISSSSYEPQVPSSPYLQRLGHLAKTESSPSAPPSADGKSSFVAPFKLPTQSFYEWHPVNRNNLPPSLLRRSPQPGEDELWQNIPELRDVLQADVDILPNDERHTPPSPSSHSASSTEYSTPPASSGRIFSPRMFETQGRDKEPPASSHSGRRPARTRALRAMPVPIPGTSVFHPSSRDAILPEDMDQTYKWLCLKYCRCPRTKSGKPGYTDKPPRHAKSNKCENMPQWVKQSKPCPIGSCQRVIPGGRADNLNTHLKRMHPCAITL